jgi:prevent-host-death family protein
LRFGLGFEHRAGLHLGDFEIDNAGTPAPEARIGLNSGGLRTRPSHLDRRARFGGDRLLRLPENALPLAEQLAIFLAMNKTVNVAEFKNRFSELLALVENGDEVIVCRRNVPLARVEPIRKPAARRAQHSVVGCMKGTVRIHGDLTGPCIPEGDWEMLT